MGFGYLNPEANKLDLARRIASPGPAPETSFSLWSFGKAGLMGIPSAAFEIYGSTQDFMRGIDQSRAEDEARIAQAFGRAPKQIPIAEGGEAARLKADRFAPDPETAHTADQVMHGLTRFVGKAVGAVATAGPVGGAALVGLEEGNTTAQRLMEGPSKVDKDTALKVGAVQGAMAAVGVALPAGGATALKTAGIALAGGPATFVAQESLAKKILEQAGYAEEAAKRDPTDPLGLALSTIAPLAVGGLHMRGLAKAKAASDLRAKREGLSYSKEADLRETATLNPAEQAASDAFERSEGNLKELRAAIKAEKNPQNRAVLEAELEKLTGKAKTEIENAAIVKAAEDPEIVAAARVHLTEQVVARDMPDIPGAHAEVLRAADSLAAGRMPEVRPIPDYELPSFKAWFGESKVVTPEGRPLVVYHGTPTPDAITEFSPGGKDGSVLSGDAYGVASYFTSSPGEAGSYAGRRDGGAILPVYVSGRILDLDGELSASDAKRVSDFANRVMLPSDKARFDVGRKTRTFSDVQEARDFFDSQRENWRQFGDGMDRARPQADAKEGKYSVEYTDFDADVQIKSGKDAETLFKAVGWDNLQAAGFDGLMMRRDGGAKWVVMHNTNGTIKSAIGNTGAFDPNSGSLTDPLRPGEVSPRESFARETAPRETASAETQALESASRPDAMPATKTEAAPPVDSQRLAKLEAENPDLPVMLPGETEAKTLSEALAEARATAADEASFADLVKVAAECALTAG